MTAPEQPAVTARDDAFAACPSPVAHSIREILRATHKDCDGCDLGRLWAEDIQVILNLAGRDTASVPDTGQARVPVITFDDEVVWLGRRYVAALNAVLCAPPGSNDVDRWRGHAEAFRQVAEQICRDLNRPAPPFGREEWRAANGIYSEEYLAELREIVRRSAGPSGDTVQAPDVAALLPVVRAAIAYHESTGPSRGDDAEDELLDRVAELPADIRTLLGTDTTPEAGQ